MKMKFLILKLNPLKVMQKTDPKPPKSVWCSISFHNISLFKITPLGWNIAHYQESDDDC